MKGNLLLIEDDELLGAGLLDNLQMEDFSVDWITGGEHGLSAALRKVHDLVLLDINLPGKSGFDVLSKVREESKVPVLIISARGTVDDRIKGFELQADDYLPKPFHFRELVLRIESLLRRRDPSPSPSQVKIGAALFDFGAMTVSRDGETEILTEKELQLVRILLSNQNQVTSREKILNQVWGTNAFPSARTVDNLIVKLRRWIEPDPTQPSIIRSHRGVGYALMSKDAPA